MITYMHHKDLANETIATTRATEIADGVHRVFDAIAAAADRYGRKPSDIALLAATKTRDVGEVMAAINAGVRLIGENRPQEIDAKMPGLARLCAARGLALGGDADAQVNADAAVGRPGVKPADQDRVAVHLIGQLQTNKINKVLPYASVIESVDSPQIASNIAKRAIARNLTIGVLLEVNESGEASKSGCDPSHAVDLAARIGSIGGLRLLGLMTIGAHVSDEAKIRRGFAHLRRTRNEILRSGAPGTEQCRALSMGMTHDMAYAIAEGSTLVRVGTAIFGPRAFI